MVWLDLCREKCKKVKHLSDELTWAQKPSHSGWMQATSAVLDENGASIPNLYFKGEYMPGKQGDKVSYALMYAHGMDKRRVFMLEAYPDHVRSHIEGKKEIYGPHIHFGDHRLEQVTREVLANIDNVFAARWASRFARHAQILSSDSRKITGPFSNTLFED